MFNLFSQILNKDQIIQTDDLLEKYSTDESLIKFSYPLLALLPNTTSEVSQILKFAYDNEIIIIPRGLGTGLSGGAIPLKPSVIVSSEMMNRIIEIDRENMMVVTQPGVITGILHSSVEEKGLFYPPDPASLESCSIGGNVAESSGGPRAVKYGTTRDYVRGIEFVMPNGDIMRFGGKVKKDATGYNIKDLIVGSEGTLGFITEITLSLLPLPKFNYDLLAPFESIDDAVEAVSQILLSGIIPSAIEFMEERAIEAARNFLKSEMPISKGKAQLLIKIDGNDKETLERSIEIIGSICEKLNSYEVLVADNKQIQDKIWKGRRSLHDAMVAMSIKRDREDVVVPISKLAFLIKGVRMLEMKYQVTIITFGHAGDGNVHINIIKTEDNQKAYEEHIDAILKDILELAVSLGGKLSGEHGIGIYKREFMNLVFSKKEISLQREIKRVFDPKNLFNPDKVLP